MTGPLAIPTELLAFAFILLCMIWDVRVRRIPNWLSAPVMVGGVAINIVCFGLPGLQASLTGLLVVVGVLLPAFAVGGIGGGDVKMMAALGALLGPLPAIQALIVGAILGGVIMMTHLVRLGRLQERLAATGKLFTAAASARSFAPLKVSDNAPDAVALPYSIPLGLGTIAVLVLSNAIGGS